MSLNLFIKARRSSGFTLLEVLVALVVLSIGLLGLAGLQLTSVTNTRDAYYRTQAIAMSYDIADRMRANRTAMLDGDYNGNTTTSTSLDCTSACDTDDMAEYDVVLWRQAVAALPGGEGIVCLDDSPNDGTSVSSPGCDGAAGDPYVVKIWWNNDRDATNANERLVTVFVP